MKRYSYTLAFMVFMGFPAGIFSAFAFDALNLKAILIVCLVALFVGGLFDIWAVRQGKNDKFYIWEYNSKTIIGNKVLGVPIEDFFLFMIATPILIISVWEATKKFLATSEISLPTILIYGTLFLLSSYLFIYRLAKTPKKAVKHKKKR